MFARSALSALALLAASEAAADSLPNRVGACVVTTIESVETRLMDESTKEPVPGSGSAVRFANGGYQVSYDTVPAIEKSKKGDRVRMCFVYRPIDCPKGDNRGNMFRTTNLRTKDSWLLPDAEHSCGGA